MTQVLIDHAIELIKGQRFGEALHLLRRAIDKDPSQWNAWYMAGQCCRFLDDTDGAIRHLSRAAELKRDEPPIFLALGIAYQLKAQWEETVRLFLPNYSNTFREQLKRDAGYSNLIGNRGTILELLGRHDEARQHFDEAAEFQP